MALDFKKIYERHYVVITNGFDWDDIADNSVAVLDEKFSIAHIGTLTNTRNPVTLWKALKNLLATRHDLAANLEIKLVGKVDHTVIASLDDFGLSRFVRKIDYMPHDQVVKCQQQSQVLLLLINNTLNSSMILTGKFFEYMAAKRPILCLGPEDGDAALILTETKAGLLAGFDDVGAMTNHILRYYELFLHNSLEVQSRQFERFSRKELTGELAQVLDDLADKTL